MTPYVLILLDMLGLTIPNPQYKQNHTYFFNITFANGLLKSEACCSITLQWSVKKLSTQLLNEA